MEQEDVLQSNTQGNKIYEIGSGELTKDIATELRNRGHFLLSDIFTFGLWLFGNDRPIKAIISQIRMDDLEDKIQAGNTEVDTYINAIEELKKVNKHIELKIYEWISFSETLDNLSFNLFLSSQKKFMGQHDLSNKSGFIKLIKKQNKITKKKLKSKLKEQKKRMKQLNIPEKHW